MIQAKIDTEYTKMKDSNINDIQGPMDDIFNTITQLFMRGI